MEVTQYTRDQAWATLHVCVVCVFYFFLFFLFLNDFDAVADS